MMLFFRLHLQPVVALLSLCYATPYEYQRKCDKTENPATWATIGSRNVRVAASACKLSPPAGRSSDISLGFGRVWRKTKGTFRTGMLFVDFPDAQATDTVQSLYKHLEPSVEWYNISSYGRLKLEIEVDKKFRRMPAESTAYGWTRNTGSMKHSKYIKDAMSTESKSPFKGNLEALYIVPTKAAKAISFSPTSPNPTRFSDGGSVTNGVVTFGQDIWSRYDYKVLNHESAHVMGLPDLYPRDGLGLPTTIYVGGWSLMGLIAGTAPDFFAWEKWKLGWIDDEQVECINSPGTTEHTISPLEQSGGIKMLVMKINDTAALAAELRINAGVDRDTCSQGLLFYTVNTATPTGYGPLKVIDPRPVKAKGCNGGRGGPLTSAAMNLEKGETDIKLPEYGISVKISGKENGNYKVTVNRQGPK